MTEEKFIIRIIIPILLCLLAASIIMLAGYGQGDNTNYTIAAFFVANGGVALTFAINLGVTIWQRHHNQWLRNGS